MFARSLRRRSGYGRDRLVSDAGRRYFSKVRAANTIEIRPSASSDGAFIVSLAREAFGEYSSRVERTILDSAMRGSTIVATDGDRRIGFAIVEFGGERSAHLAAISVLETERGRGVGRRILRAAEGLARARGARTLALFTAESNVAALELFLRNGFERVANDSIRYPRGQRAVRLRKALD
jgi:ribosomal protein S18 acetylase RimI-like enzyme